ncbi:unnamed protein product, partial [Staurois parvus]
MDTDRWHSWGYTDHQGTLIISALMICVHVPSKQGRTDHLETRAPAQGFLEFGQGHRGPMI